MDTRDRSLPDFDALWDYNEPAATEKRFREIISHARSSGNVSYLVQLLSQIARTEALQGHYDAAHLTIDEAEARCPPDDRTAHSRNLLERGRVFNSSGDPARARHYFLQAWELASQAGEDFHAVDAAHMLAIVEAPERKLDWNLQAMDVARKSADPRAQSWLGSLYNNMGWTYHDLGRYEDALSCFRQGLQWQREHDRPKEGRIAAWTVGRALRSLGRYQEALRIQEANLSENDGTGDSDGFIQEELGECLLALGRPDEARKHFLLAHAALSTDPWIADNEPARLERLQTMGKADEPA